MTYNVMDVDMSLWLDNFDGNIAEAIQPMIEGYSLNCIDDGAVPR
jgi:hypothetical protein